MLDPAQTVQIFEEMDRLLADRWQRIKELEASLSTATSKLDAAQKRITAAAKAFSYMESGSVPWTVFDHDKFMAAFDEFTWSQEPK